METQNYSKTFYFYEKLRTLDIYGSLCWLFHAQVSNVLSSIEICFVETYCKEASTFIALSQYKLKSIEALNFKQLW